MFEKGIDRYDICRDTENLRPDMLFYQPKFWGSLESSRAAMSVLRGYEEMLGVFCSPYFFQLTEDMIASDGYVLRFWRSVSGDMYTAANIGECSFANLVISVRSLS